MRIEENPIEEDDSLQLGHVKIWSTGRPQPVIHLFDGRHWPRHRIAQMENIVGCA